MARPRYSNSGFSSEQLRSLGNYPDGPRSTVALSRIGSKLKMLWWFWGAANKIIMISILLKLLFLHEFGERKYRQKLEASAVTTIGDSMMKKALQLDPLTEEIWKLIDPDRRKA